MRALRILLITAVILAAIFVGVDRWAVGYAENEAASRIQTSEGLASTPKVSITGFPFLTQVLGGELDEVDASIGDISASSQGTSVVISQLEAKLTGVVIDSGFTSATAKRATGSALITYAELLKATKADTAAPVQLTAGLTAAVKQLSDGGNGKIKVGIRIAGTVLGQSVDRDTSVLSTVTVVDGNTINVKADSLPDFPGISFVDGEMRSVTDFTQKVDGLPAGIELSEVEPAPTGVRIAVAGSQVKLVG
jgi:hypothetical protein